MQTQLFMISFLSASRLLFWLTHDPGGPVWNQTPCRKEGQLISESGACRGEVWDLRTSGTRFKCSHAPLTLYDIIWLIFKKKTNSSNPSTVHLIASLLSWHLTFRFMKAFRERFFQKIIQFPEISRSWNCHMVSFSFLFPCRLPLWRSRHMQKQEAGTLGISMTTTHTCTPMSTCTQPRPAQTSLSPRHGAPSGLWCICLLLSDPPQQPASAPDRTDTIWV